ncbi:hypothetical protein AL073_15910 [Loktanella sp. 1ANDIMAR09]|nr:hypothetical protein AL073_15910 [Loktanella sp. 1ANDIMAR09]
MHPAANGGNELIVLKNSAFWAETTNFFAIQGEHLVLARGSAKISLCRWWASPERLVHTSS